MSASVERDASPLAAQDPAFTAALAAQAVPALLARVKPAFITVIAAWQHRVRTLAIGGRRVAVDATGCYRVD